MKLGSREGAMQDGRDDLKSNSPLLPQATEEVHDNQGFEDSAAKGSEGGEHKNAA